MKALSIRQPWAWAILHAGKRIENRDWRSCHYRGPLLIHAAKGCGIEEYADAAMGMKHEGLAWPEQHALPVGAPPLPILPALAKLDRGGIVGVCRLVGVVDRDGLYTPSVAPDLDMRWFAGPIGLILADVRPLPFVPFKGALGFFDVPDHLVPNARKAGAL